MRPQRKGRRKEHNSGNSTKSNDQQKRDILIELRKGIPLRIFDTVPDPELTPGPGTRILCRDFPAIPFSEVESCWVGPRFPAQHFFVF